MHNVFITNDIKEDHWNEFLNRCDDATIYHTPQWKKLLELTFGYKPYYLFVKDDTDQLIGLLPLSYIASKITGDRLCCLPFAHECGYIGDNEAFNQLILAEALRLYKQLDLDRIEIRTQLSGQFSKSFDFSTYILNLSNDVDAVWKSLDKSSVRWAIKKAERMGVKVEASENPDDIPEFFELNCLTKKELGVPSHPLKFFKNLFSLFDNSVRLFTSEYQGKIIGGGVMMYYKNTVLYGYGAAHPEYLKSYPYNAFIWSAIKDASLNGYRSFDFGRVSRESTGLANFKKRWGTYEKILCYSAFPSPLSKREGVKYRLGTKVLKNMPFSMYNKLSTNMFKHFG